MQLYDFVAVVQCNLLLTHALVGTDRAYADGIVLKDSRTHLTPSQSCPACSLHVPSASPAGFSYVCVSEGSSHLHGQLVYRYQDFVITTVHLICFHVNTHKKWLDYHLFKQLGMEK